HVHGVPESETQPVSSAPKSLDSRLVAVARARSHLIKPQDLSLCARPLFLEVPYDCGRRSQRLNTTGRSAAARQRGVESDLYVPNVTCLTAVTQDEITVVDDAAAHSCTDDNMNSRSRLERTCVELGPSGCSSIVDGCHPLDTAELVSDQFGPRYVAVILEMASPNDNSVYIYRARGTDADR